MYYIDALLKSLCEKIPCLADIRNLYVRERSEGITLNQQEQERVASIIDTEEAILVSFFSLVLFYKNTSELVEL